MTWCNCDLDYSYDILLDEDSPLDSFITAATCSLSLTDQRELFRQMSARLGREICPVISETSDLTNEDWTVITGRNQCSDAPELSLAECLEIFAGLDYDGREAAWVGLNTFLHNSCIDQQERLKRLASGGVR